MMFRFLILGVWLSIPLLAVESGMGAFGYVRLQTSFQDDKENTCFQAPGAGSKYRLGNECETWLELGTFQDITFDSDIQIHNQVRPLFTGANEETVDFFDWGEVYSEVSGLFDNSAKVWIGRRFYERYDSHISDYWPLNMSGDGLGISKVDLGGVDLSYALMVAHLDPTTDTTDKAALHLSHDLRIVKQYDRAEATLFLNYMTLEGRKFDATHEGQIMTAMPWGFSTKTAAFSTNGSIWKGRT